MQDSSYLNLPFFDSNHESLSKNLHEWAKSHLHDVDHTDVDSQCRQLVSQLGRDGWLKFCISGQGYGGQHEQIDNRSICLIREILAKHSGLADFAFAMQGLGSGAICLFGSELQKQHYLPAWHKAARLQLLH